MRLLTFVCFVVCGAISYPANAQQQIVIKAQLKDEEEE